MHSDFITGRPVDASNNRMVITGSTLRISPIEKDDEGFYDCLAENDAGRELASAELSVPARSKRVVPPLNWRNWLMPVPWYFKYIWIARIMLQLVNK